MPHVTHRIKRAKRARQGGVARVGTCSPRKISDVLRSLLVPFWVKQQEFRPGVGPAYRYLYPSAYVIVYAEARWVWEHAPSRKFFEFNAVRWLLRLFWGPKHHYYLSWHGNKIQIHFMFACMEVDIHLRLQSLGKLREGATHAIQSKY